MRKLAHSAAVLIVTVFFAGCDDAGGNGGSDPVCTPQEKKCDGDDVLKCTADGTDWTFFKSCEGGCEGGECLEVCEPQCENQECGDDGCGGSCGECDPGTECSEGECVEICEADCAGKECGDDGCGGDCGPCPAGSECQGTTCVTVSNECGECPDGTTCGYLEDQPVWCAGEGCPDGLDFVGECGGDGNTSIWCDEENDVMYAVDCDHLDADWLCGFTDDGYYDCIPACEPQCDGLDCGDDGCGGSCGSCDSPFSCADGQCVCTPNCAGKSCGDNGCGGSCGQCIAPDVCDAGQCVQPPCDPTESIDISVTYDAALQPYDNVLFPTYVAHLLGSDFFMEGDWNFATFELTNTCGTSSFSVVLSTELEGYLDPGEKLVSVGPGETISVPLNPVLQFSDLYSLPAPLSGSLHSEVAVQNGQLLYSESDTATILPLDKIILGHSWLPILGGYTAHELAAVMVTPQDEDDLVSTLVADSASNNPPPWGNSFPSGYSFASPGNAKSVQDTQSGIKPGNVRTYPFFMHAGESIQGQLTNVEDDSWFGDDDIAFYLMKDAEFWNFMDGLEFNYILGEYDAITGHQFQHTAVDAGWYVIVLWNTPDNSADRTVTTWRKITREETVRLVLGSVFETLRDYGMNYTSISGSVFPATQTVRLPADTITQGSGNCIDGTFVFASALEAMGLEPLLVFVPGHAFVAVWDGCGDAFGSCGESDRTPWFLETTMVGSEGVDFWDAYSSGLSEFIESDQLGEADLIDVQAMRQEGIWPVAK